MGEILLDDPLTGISPLQSTADGLQSPAYNLWGQPVRQGQQRGVTLRGGKKLLVR